MATDTTKVLVGAGVVSIGAYVAAGGAGSLTDIGHTKNPVTITPNFDDYEVVTERFQGPIKKIPIMVRYKIKVSYLEVPLENYRASLRQAAGNLTGTPPNLTLRVGTAAEQYHQLTIVGPGVGTTGVRTVTIWRCIVESVGDVAYAKGGEQMLDVTFDALLDDSVATADKVMKIVDA